MVTTIKLFLVVIIATITGHACAQVAEDTVRQFILHQSNLKTNTIRHPAEVQVFYESIQYQPAWSANPEAQQALLQLLERAADLGLEEKDYQYPTIQLLKNKPGAAWAADHSVQTEVSLTDAAIHFFHDAAYGNPPSPVSYTGSDCRMQLYDIPLLLSEALRRKKLHDLLTQLEPASKAYGICKNKVIQLNETAARHDFKEVTISSAKPDTTNIPLLVKLKQLGIIDSHYPGMTPAEVKQKVKQAQQLLSLPDNGTLNKETLDALNIPLTARITQLNTCLNHIRWLTSCNAFQSGVIVNIPSASLLVYKQQSIVLESRVIVGKRSTPTPTLCSMIKEVVLYPYWTVPEKIAVRELLPHIRKNPGYLRENNFQVLNKQGSIVNASAVNWRALHPGNFPYIIRQSTGCDNSLGIVKFNFYNPYSVYLHDTPSKQLFKTGRRFYSHGCVRVQKAMELAHLILKNNAVIDSLECKGCLPNQSPVVVPVSDPMQVTILYTPAWYDAAGEIRFFEDVYQRSIIQLNPEP